jgi:hypothetical protein
MDLPDIFNMNIRFMGVTARNATSATHQLKPSH